MLPYPHLNEVENVVQKVFATRDSVKTYEFLFAARVYIRVVHTRSTSSRPGRRKSRRVTLARAETLLPPTPSVCVAPDIYNITRRVSDLPTYPRSKTNFSLLTLSPPRSTSRSYVAFSRSSWFTAFCRSQTLRCWPGKKNFEKIVASRRVVQRPHFTHRHIDRLEYSIACVCVCFFLFFFNEYETTYDQLR